MTDWREEAKRLMISTASTDELGDAARLGAGAYSEAKPLVSSSAAVHSSQVTEMNEFIRKNGIQGAEHRPDGRVQFTSRRARRDYLRARGMADFSGGYGD